ncbi:MAG: thioredoxin [Bacillales bacterium]|jgi:thioredoxin-like negative regulator of GroEL|nr:thioredoxin [Bacillales bacterium]MDF2946583.1 thioredoxin [Bacillales bacterium]
MKKIVIFAVILVALFGAIAFVTMQSNKDASEGNPYGKETLHPETIKSLKDPNYQNVITPEQLEEKNAAGEPVTVYVFSPLCKYCKEATPGLMSASKAVGTEIKMMNVLEYEDMFNKLGIEGTPTLLQFKGGKEVARVKGNVGEEGFKQFLEANK